MGSRFSIVENVLVKNVSMTNAATGARIKVYALPPIPDVLSDGGAILVNY